MSVRITPLTGRSLGEVERRALAMLAEKAIEVSHMALDGMQGKLVDADAAMALLFEGCAALAVAFPGDTDHQTLRMLLTRTGLAAAIPGRPANDQNPVGAA